MSDMTTDAIPAPPDLSAHLAIDGAAAAIDFYVRAFSAKLLGKQPTPDGKKLIHAALAFGNGLLMLSDDFPEMNSGKSRHPRALGGSGVTIHLNVPDADAVFERAVAAGAKVVMPLADMFWGDRYGILEDPFGHRWSIGTPKRKVPDDELAAAARQYFS